jgi:hypothetical protein
LWEEGENNAAAPPLVIPAKAGIQYSRDRCA